MCVFDELLPTFVTLRHEDVRSIGIPDLSVTGGGQTTWWEFKHAVPKYPTFGLQELMMKRLAAHGYCRYVVWWEVGADLRTLIVHPLALKDMVSEVEFHGHDHAAVVAFIQQVHQG